MSRSTTTNFQIKQSGIDEFDIEHVCVNASATPTPLDDIALSPSNNDGGGEGECATESVRRGKFTSCFMSSVVVNKKTASLALIGVGVMLGASVYGAVEHNQQQQALASVIASNSKASKAVSFCESEPAISCGATFSNQKVVLSEDLFCVDDVASATRLEKRTLNAAIELTGADAVIDCKGHTIHQVSGVSAVNCDQTLGVARGRSDNREQMKDDCNLFYQGGILLRNGAKAINCKVQQFYDGFIVMDGSEVKKSEAFGNRRGVLVDHRVGSSQSEEAKISDLYVHGNHFGVRVFVRPASESAYAAAFDFEEDYDDNLARSDFDNQDKTASSSSAVAAANDVNVAMSPAAAADTVVEVKDITSKFNFGTGIRLEGPGGITVEDSISSYNGNSGIFVRGRGVDEQSATEVHFKGSVSSHHNADRGISIRNDYAKAFVMGELNTYLNEDDGLGVFEASDSAFFMDGRGKVNSCINVGYDILIRNSPNFIFDGSGDTCYDKAVGPTGPINIGECTNPCPLCA